MGTGLFDTGLYAFNWQGVLSAFAGLAALSLGVVVVVRERRSRSGPAFLVLAVTVAVWLLGFAGMYFSRTPALALEWARIGFVGVPLIPAAGYHFAVAVSGTYRRRRVFVAGFWAAGTVFAVAALATDRLIDGLYRYSWGFYPRYDGLTPVYLGYFAVVLVLALQELWRQYRAAVPGAEKQRIQMLMLGIAVAYLAAVDFLPKFGVDVYPVGFAVILGFLGIMAWGILRYRLVPITPAVAGDEVLATMADPVIVCDRDRRIRIVNEAFKSVTGFADKDVVGRPLGSFLHASGVGDLALDEVLEDPRVRHRELELAGRDRKGVPVSVSVSHLGKDEAEALGAVVIARDVRERRRMEDALQRARFVMQRTDDAVFWFGPEGQFLEVNDAACRSLGYPREELLEMSVDDVDPDYADKRLDEALDAVRAEEFQVFESRHRRADGSTFPVEITANYLPFRGRDLFCAFARNITERKEAEEALRRSEAKYRRILESIEDGYFEVDLAGNLTFFNDALGDILGYAPGELVGMNNRDYMDQENARKVYEAFNRVYRTGEPETGFDWEVIRDDGAIRSVEASVSLIEDRDGEPRGFRGIVRDVTDRKELEEQLRQAQKLEAIGQLAAGIAHDFNNLLTGISGFTELALGELAEDSSVAEDLRSVREFAARGADLTRRLLAFGRRQALDPVPLDINELIDSTAKILRRTLGDDIAVVLETDAKLGRVRADPTAMQQVLTNLALNARDAMPDGGTLVIETANVVLDEEFARHHRGVEPGPHVMLGVTDSGEGMDEVVRQRIFEPFFSTKESGRGSGLGLPMVYGIVSQHGGTIWVYSEPGRGTTFKIYLPREETFELDAPAVVYSEEEAPTTSVEHEGDETILLVEDEGKIREALERFLTGLGYEVLVASRPEQAEELFVERGEAVDLLVTDVVLPGADGVELHRRLSDSRPSLRVLYVSGYPSRKIGRSLDEVQVAPLLQKPFTPEKLARRVRQVLDG